MPAKKQEGITINTEELSTKRANLFQIKVFFFFKHNPEVGRRGAGQGEGQREKGKNACQQSL